MGRVEECVGGVAKWVGSVEAEVYVVIAGGSAKLLCTYVWNACSHKLFVYVIITVL